MTHPGRCLNRFRRDALASVPIAEGAAQETSSHLCLGPVAAALDKQHEHRSATSRATPPARARSWIFCFSSVPQYSSHACPRHTCTSSAATKVGGLTVRAASAIRCRCTPERRAHGGSSVSNRAPHRRLRAFGDAPSASARKRVRWPKPQGAEGGTEPPPHNQTSKHVSRDFRLGRNDARPETCPISSFIRSRTSK